MDSLAHVHLHFPYGSDIRIPLNDMNVLFQLLDLELMNHYPSAQTPVNRGYSARYRRLRATLNPRRIEGPRMTVGDARHCLTTTRQVLLQDRLYYLMQWNIEQRGAIVLYGGISKLERSWQPAIDGEKRMGAVGV